MGERREGMTMFLHRVFVALNKNLNFPLRIALVNVTKSAVS